MDNFLEYIERYKFAILGTIVIHIGVFVYANFATIQKPYKLVDEGVEIPIPLDEIEFDEEMMELLDIPPKTETSQEILNMSADANDARDKAFEDYSTQELETFDETSAKELEKQFFEEWAATHGDPNSTANIEDKDKNKDNNPTDRINKDNIKTNGSNAVAGEVMVSFDLPNRKAFSLPKPGYTCNSSGTVVIDIKVDKAGDVKSVSVNSGASRGADECMISKALRYAEKSRFNLGSNAPNSQSGTITYKFVKG
ncbi:MAG: energy transducer TonB [Crocinitomicaceae bacterium]